MPVDRGTPLVRIRRRVPAETAKPAGSIKA